jgi:hypothetical protein
VFWKVENPDKGGNAILAKIEFETPCASLARHCEARSEA